VKQLNIADEWERRLRDNSRAEGRRADCVGRVEGRKCCLYTGRGAGPQSVAPSPKTQKVPKPVPVAQHSHHPGREPGRKEIPDPHLLLVGIFFYFLFLRKKPPILLGVFSIPSRVCSSAACTPEDRQLSPVELCSAWCASAGSILYLIIPSLTDRTFEFGYPTLSHHNPRQFGSSRSRRNATT
jgi:hypothetical protein